VAAAADHALLQAAGVAPRSLLASEPETSGPRLPELVAR
jgi:hypothetical protein